MWRWVLVAFLGCGHGASPSREVIDSIASRYPRAIAPRANVFGSPWTVGRSATYRLNGGERFDRMTVVAIDACGTWFENAVVTEARRYAYLVCMGPPGGDVLDNVKEVRFEERSEPSTRVEFASRDEMWNAIGRIVLRAQERPSSDEELVGAEVRDRSVVSDLADRRLHPEVLSEPPIWYGLSCGVGQHRGGDLDPETSWSFSAKVRTRWSQTTSFIAELGGATGADRESDSTLDQQLLLAHVGARWMPFQYTLFVQGLLGATRWERLHDDDAIEAATGPSGAFSIGLVTDLTGRDWRGVVELRDTVMNLSEGIGWRHRWELIVGVELGLGPFGRGN